MAPIQLWTSCRAGKYHGNRQSTCVPTAACVPSRVASGAPSQSPHGWAAAAATISPVAGEDNCSTVQQRREASTLRPRLQRSAPASPLQQPQLRTHHAEGAPWSGAVTPHPRSQVPRSPHGGPGSQQQRPNQQQQWRRDPPSAATRQQQGRPSTVGPAAVTLSPRHSGFGLRTGLALTWLGTNSGTPTLERNVSCTLVRVSGVVQMVDCGEGTARQLMTLEGSLNLADIDGIFITHLHGDHCFGLPAALAIIDDMKAKGQADPARRRHHVYGPPGLAELLQVSLIGTGLVQRLQLPLLVTELVKSPAAAHPPQPMAQALGQHRRRQMKDTNGHVDRSDTHEVAAGRNEDCGVEVLVQRLAARRVQDVVELTAAVRAVQPRVAALEEVWSPPRYASSSQYGAPYSASNRNDMSISYDDDLDEAGEGGGGGSPFRRPKFVAAEGLFWEFPGCAGVRVRAAQLQHRVPCWGYVFAEAQPYEADAMRRKAVVLGDTVSSRAIAPLAAGCDVMSHEATFARGMEMKACKAQHSTGWMAGAFAEAVGARSLVLTHFSSRYRDAPQSSNSERISVRVAGHEEVEQQAYAVAGLLREAASTYSRAEHLFAATDFYTHHVPLRRVSESAREAVDAGRGAREQ